MVAVYAYKYLNKYWKGHSDSFFDVARLSTKLSRRFYKTILYTDLQTQELFKSKNIEFDEVIIVDSFSEVTENSYGLAKILAMMKQNTPYVILDLDTLLFEPVNTTSTIAYGYNEIAPKTLVGVDYIHNHYIKYYDLFKDRLTVNTYEIDWTVFPNNSLVVVNNPQLVTDIYKEILKIIDGRYTSTSVQYYEQKLLFDYLRDCKTKIKFFYDKPPIIEHELDNYTFREILSKKFLHFDFYFRHPSSKKVLNELQNFFK